MEDKRAGSPAVYRVEHTLTCPFFTSSHFHLSNKRSFILGFSLQFSATPAVMLRSLVKCKVCLTSDTDEETWECLSGDKDGGHRFDSLAEAALLPYSLANVCFYSISVVSADWLVFLSVWRQVLRRALATQNLTFAGLLGTTTAFSIFAHVR